MTPNQRARELREAFSHEFTFAVGDPDDSYMLSVISDAARERLAQLEGQALVIEKVNGEWPEWAQRAVSGWLETDEDGNQTDLRAKSPDKLDNLLEAQMQLVPLPDRSTT